MSQRNPMNERYNTERKGQTRKSSASAKPKSERAATLRDPAPKTRKQKKKERQEREAKQRKRIVAVNARYEDTQEYKHLRHIWWGGLIAAICCTALSFVMSTYPEFFSFLPEDILYSASMVFMVGAYGFIIFAFYIDFSRIRKGRRAFENRALYDNSKEARAMQKQARAEARERKREEEAQAKEEAENPPAESKGIFGFFKRDKKAPAKDAATDTEETAEAEEPATSAKKPKKDKGKSKGNAEKAPEATEDTAEEEAPKDAEDAAIEEATETTDGAQAEATDAPVATEEIEAIPDVEENEAK